MTHEPRKFSLGKCVHAVWRRTQRKHLVAGLFTFVHWGIPLFLVGMTVDWLIDSPPAGRLAILVLVLLIPLLKAWKKGWRNLRRFDPTRAAVAIEEHEGGLESLLATAVDLEQSGIAPGTSASLAEATRQKAEKVAAGLQPAKIVTFRALRLPAAIVLALGGVILAFALVNAPFLNTGLARIFNPWSAIGYPTDTEIDPGKGNLIVREGDRATISIGISGKIPETATLFLQTGEGDPRELEIEVKDSTMKYLIASASRDFAYRVEAGDAKSGWYEVDVIPAPRLAGVKVSLEYPSYLEREKETIEALTLTVPESTRVHWDLTLDQPVRSAILHRDDGDPIPLEVTGDGRQLVIDETVEASRGYSFSWIEREHDFKFTSPRYYLQVSSDQDPQVEFTKPETNLNALLGRKLDLMVRARDDHGIGSTKITYQVNLLPAKTVTLDTPIDHRGSEQTLGWDYRTALPDLKVGDTASFIVEVTDRYPGPDGPHLARSETRRLTFLSLEDYLAQILRKQDRLLTRVRTIYRQERAAHELLRKLDPQDPAFLQTCQLEAIRQEMLREQLKETARQVQDILDDLAANQVEDALEKDGLVLVKDGIEEIAEQQIATAASLLRNQAERGSTEAVETVNLAARKLAGLVLLRGIDSAREVFARESRMLAHEQAALRLLTLQTNNRMTPDDLAARHESLSRWTRELITSLREGMRYDKRPIAVLQLTRRIKELAANDRLKTLENIATLIRQKKFSDAASLQTELIASYLKAEYSMRTGAEYAAIMDFRERLARIRAAHESLQTTCQAMSPGDFETKHSDLAATQAAIRDDLIPALLPPVPTPRSRLFDQTLPETPPVDGIRLAAEKALNEALAHLSSGNQEPALSRQMEATDKLAHLDRILERSTIELGLRTSGLTTLVSNATENINLLEDFESRQIVLLEQTEEAALDEKPSKPLAETQVILTGDVALMATDLATLRQSNPEVLPLLDLLTQLDFFLKKAASALSEDKGEDALGYQEQAADLLAEALELAQGQIERLTLLQDLYTFQRAVGNASGWMTDIVAEQKDLILATKNATSETSAAIVPVIKNLRQCLVDIAPVLDLVAGRLDAGTPLLFAGTDLEDAIFGIEDGDFLDAEDAQTVAAESLVKVRGLVSAVADQTGYTAEIVEFLHRTQSEAALMAFRQKQIRQKLAAAPEQIPPDLLPTQTKLLEQALAYRDALLKATGMPAFSLPSEKMTAARAALESAQLDEADKQMELAQTDLSTNAEELFLILTMLHGLPAIEVTSASDPALVLLTEVLALASDQRRLSRETASASARPDIQSLVARQTKMLEISSKTLTTIPLHPKLIEINGHLARAVSALANSDQPAASQHQNLADQTLRHYVIEQALILETAKDPPSSSDEPVLSENETNDLYESTANFVSDFVSGEAPQDKRTEWEVLGNRNRAALNQNFARELPLEYRAILKNYYERVAK